jgi:hypothetical protein
MAIKVTDSLVLSLAAASTEIYFAFRTWFNLFFIAAASCCLELKKNGDAFGNFLRGGAVGSWSHEL